MICSNMFSAFFTQWPSYKCSTIKHTKIVWSLMVVCLVGPQKLLKQLRIIITHLGKNCLRVDLALNPVFNCSSRLFVERKPTKINYCCASQLFSPVMQNSSSGGRWFLASREQIFCLQFTNSKLESWGFILFLVGHSRQLLIFDFFSSFQYS